MFDISVNDGVSLVILMDHIKGFSVPSPQVGSLPVLNVVSEDSSHLLELGFKVDHLLRSGGNLTKGKLLFAGNIFIQNLEKKLCHKSLNVLLIHFLCVNSLYVHLRDIGLISLTHLIESADQVIPLLSQICELSIKIKLLLSILHFSVSQMI